MSKVINKLLIVATCLTSMFMTGCLHKFPYFIHEETEQYRNRPHDIIFKKAPEFVRDEVAIIPDFFQVDELNPDVTTAFVYFASKSPKTIYIEKVEILNSSRPPLTISVDKEFVINEKAFDGDYFSNAIRLGQYAKSVKKEVASRLDTAFDEGGFKMKLYFKVEQGISHELLFDMRTKKSVGIALKHW